MAKSYYFDTIASSEILDKERAIRNTERGFLNKINNMFIYSGLPDTIPARFLELYLQTRGNCFITEVEGNLYAFVGGLGGEPDPYYQPTLYTVANPALKFSKNLKIGEEGILCRNDMLMLGLMPVIHKYSVLLVENLLSFRVAAINTRIAFVMDATDDNAYESAKEYLKQVEEGRLGVISSDDLFSHINVNPAAVHDRCIIDLIELHQYIIAQLYSEIGIPDNYNMKRERLTSAEAEMQQTKPAVSLEDMYVERCIFCDAVNEKYGTNIRVELNERWENKDGDTERSDSGIQDKRDI